MGINENISEDERLTACRFARVLNVNGKGKFYQSTIADAALAAHLVESLMRGATAEQIMQNLKTAVKTKNILEQGGTASLAGILRLAFRAKRARHQQNLEKSSEG